jgi:hypothetical protein
MKPAVSLTAALLAGNLHAEPQRLFLTYGDYMTGFNDTPGMVLRLLAAAQPDQPGYTRLPLGIGAHGDTIGIWKSGSVGWITGRGTVSNTNWRDNPRAIKIAETVQGRPADLVMVQLDLRYVTDKRDRDKQALTDQAVAGYVAAAKQAGARLVFCVLPGGQHLPMKRGKTEPVKKLAADFEMEFKLLDAECRRLTKAHGAVMAPTYLAFAILRQNHPGLDIHLPVDLTDGHPSPRDSYLFACTVAFALLDQKPDKLPAPAQIFAHLNQPPKGKDAPPKPPVTMTAEEQAAIHEAAWAAVAQMRK